MIDTDKYVGHTPAEQWKVIDGLGEAPPVDFVAMSNANADEYGCCENQSILAHAWQIFDGSEEKTGKTHDWKAIKGADARLIADAPLLLQEVKRLRPMADELIAIWEILEEDYPHVDRAIVKELIERKIGGYEVIA